MIEIEFSDPHAFTSTFSQLSIAEQSEVQTFGPDVADGKWLIKTGSQELADKMLAMDTSEIKVDLISRIEAERQRRIYQVATPDAQAAAYRKSIALLHKGEANWDANDQAVVDRFEAANQAIEAITAAADTLIAMDQQPADFADDSHWPNLAA